MALGQAVHALKHALGELRYHTVVYTHLVPQMSAYPYQQQPDANPYCNDH
jgi:hypothetical protein